MSFSWTRDSRAFIIDLWHSKNMKALKSQLAMELLADPKARSELRRFLVANRFESSEVAIGRIQIHRGTSAATTVRAIFVPKAKID